MTIYKYDNKTWKIINKNVVLIKYFKLYQNQNWNTWHI